MEYPRPDLPDTEKRQLALAARRLLALPRMRQEIMIASLLYENAQLAAECNDHRQARGYDPLPLYGPKTG